MSAVAGQLVDYLTTIESENLRTASAQNTLIASFMELFELYDGCNRPNWGGNDERRIGVAAVCAAYDFLKLLPAKYQRPDLIPEPQGAVAMEWRFGQFKSLILSFSGNGYLEFSLLNGRASNSAGRMAIYRGVMPLEVTRFLRDVST